MVCQHGQRHNSQGHNAPCRYVERHAARFENIVRQQRRQKWLDWLGEGNPQLGSNSNLKVESVVSIPMLAELAGMVGQRWLLKASHRPVAGDMQLGQN